MFKEKEHFLIFLVSLLIFFCVIWQIWDYIKLSREQRNILNLLDKEISTTIINIIISSPRFGPLVPEDVLSDKLFCFLSKDNNPVKGIELLNYKDEPLLSLSGPEKGKYNNNSEVFRKLSGNYLTKTKLFSGMIPPENIHIIPVIVRKKDISAFVNLLIESVSTDNELWNCLPPEGKQINGKIRQILSKKYFRDKTLYKIKYILNVSPINQTIRKELIEKNITLFFCLLTGGVAIWSLIKLRETVNIKILLAIEQERNEYLKEKHLLAAGLAHEIKNPLNLVRGIAQSLKESEDIKNETRRNVAIMIEEVDRINGRLKNFLSYANIKEPQLKSVEIKQIINDLITLLAIDCEDKFITIMDNTEHITILADEDFLRQIIFNLLHNSIKAVSPHGQIMINSFRKEDYLEIEIEDNSRGIPPELTDDIFKPYVKLNSGGTGLGLAIVKQLCLKQKWNIKYLQKKNTGAVFRIEGIKIA